MEHLAPKYWPQDKRYGFCYLPLEKKQLGCNMKTGNPFGPFWDGLKVNFTEDIVYQLSYGKNAKKQWLSSYPASNYPVLAFRGAPAAFPVLKEHKNLQKYLVFNDKIVNESLTYINENFPKENFIGIHLRNNIDWEHACKDVEKLKTQNYMASPQCIDEDSQKIVTSKMCFPDDKEILRYLRWFQPFELLLKYIFFTD